MCLFSQFPILSHGHIIMVKTFLTYYYGVLGTVTSWFFLYVNMTDLTQAVQITSLFFSAIGSFAGALLACVKVAEKFSPNSIPQMFKKSKK
jgi:hypothetical protein